MKLISAAVRNYRVHRDTQVKFAPGLNLITGPNESGKSTLVEAIHRALFLRARGTTAAHERMRSTTSPGTPEVIVAFEQNGKTCTLTKQFGRGTLLDVTGEATRREAEAEELLAKLLRSGDTIQGGGVDSKLELRWAHLWAWQGKSSSAPGETAREQNAELVRCLQELGGGAVVSSALDGRLLTRFRTAVDEAFVRTRGYRAGSAVAEAQEALAQAEAALADAESKLKQTEGCAAEYEETTGFLADTGAQSQQLEQELAQAQKRQEQARKLAEQCKEAELEHQAAEKEMTRLREAVDAIAAARKKVGTAREEIGQKDEAAKEQQQKAAVARTAADELLNERQPKRDELARAQKGVDACAAVLDLLDKQAHLSDLGTAVAQVAELEQKKLGYDEELAQLPTLSRRDVTALRQLRDTLSKAEATLAATSARLELLEAKVPVTVDGKPIAAGSAITVSDAVEVRIGEVAGFRLVPGGGQTIVEARDAVETARKALDATLVKLGVASVEAAETVINRLSELTSAQNAIAKALDAMHADELKAKHTAATLGCKQAKARLEQLSDGLPEFAPAPTRESATAALDQARATHATADQGCTAAEQQLKEQNTLAGSLAGVASKAVEAIAKARAEQAGAEGALRGLVAAYGDDDALEQKTKDCKTRLDSASQRADSLGKSLADLQPDLIAGDVERLGRSLENLRGQINDKRTRQQIALSHLQSAGTSDPRAEEAMTRQRRNRAAVRFHELEAQAGASRRLATLFEEEQARASASIAAPLNERIADYVRCLFGPDANASFALEPNGTLGCLVVSRAGVDLGTFDFGALSSGAKEQVGVAVRLAMAEVLAANHGGCLPVVLDDAFANSDPERVRELQRMLDLAARRGLQVIVLTCNPNDYRALGAAMTYELRRPVLRTVAPPPPPPQPAGADAAADDADTEPDAPRPEGVPAAARADAAGQADMDAVLEFVGSHNGVSRSEVAHGLSFDDQMARGILKDLLAAGLIRKEGETRGTKYFAVA